MNHPNKWIIFLLFAGIIAVIAGCGDKANKPSNTDLPSTGQSATSADAGGKQGEAGSDKQDEPAQPDTTPSSSPVSTPDPSSSEPPKNQTGKQDTVQVVAEPQDVAVLVNKTNRLPEGYIPDDLVEPAVDFIFKEKLEKRKLRKVAAEALEQLFAGAEQDGIFLAGVSGYRSQATQEILFNSYAKKSGAEAANKYSAKPGFSEHQTGLAIDVSSSTGQCAAEDCFAGTDEAVWLAENAAEYGFIIRYPQGKDEITGYQYEPWHLRYVGVEIATEIADEAITLEEYNDQAVATAKKK